MHRWSRYMLIAGMCAGCHMPSATQHVNVQSPPLFRQVDSTLDVYIGGQPDGYDTLQQRGIRSVIDVDATAPRAHPPGSMKVLHLPLRYSGITAEEASALASALGTMERPIYIHCHHGTNRAPTAAAVGLVGTGEWVPEQGRRLLEQAGTDPAFTGLHFSVESAVEIPLDERRSIGLTGYKTESLAVQMAGIDSSATSLARSLDRGRSVPGAATTAAELVDLFRVAFDASPMVEHAPFRAHALEAIEQATALEHALRADRFDQARVAFDALNASCMDCHRQYRD